MYKITITVRPTMSITGYSLLNSMLSIAYNTSIAGSLLLTVIVEHKFLRKGLESQILHLYAGWVK